MKCISLHQPWASLIVLGEKRFETRSWPTKHRGPLLIHAAKKRSGELIEMCGKTPFFEALNHADKGPWKFGDSIFNRLPFGVIIGRVEVVECYIVRDFNSAVKLVTPDLRLENIPLPTGKEFAFGDYAVGRFAWKLVDPVRFAKPIPWRGMQGIFNVETSDFDERV